jgi:hypothetical protein
MAAGNDPWILHPNQLAPITGEASLMALNFRFSPGCRWRGFCEPDFLDEKALEAGIRGRIYAFVVSHELH